MEEFVVGDELTSSISFLAKSMGSYTKVVHVIKNREISQEPANIWVVVPLSLSRLDNDYQTPSPSI